MTCPDCKQEMRKDVAGVCRREPGRPIESVSFDVHICDCRGPGRQVLLSDGRDLLAFWQEHPQTAPPDHGGLSEPHRLAMAAQAAKMETPA